MTEENTINQEMLEIVKALTAKVEAIEKTLFAKDNLLMKAGLVVANTPVPIMDNNTANINVDNMDWSDIHKMVEKAGGQ
jgi:hypothetical protein